MSSATTAAAQPWGVQELSSRVVLPLTIDSDEFVPSRVGPLHTYSAMLDTRRRIVANAWAGDASLLGPATSGADARALSPDECQESDVARMDIPSCTPVAPADVDRVEVYSGWDFVTPPQDTRFRDELNHPSSPQPLRVIVESMQMPGAFLRFLSGPAALHTTTWSTLPGGVPSGEGTGFTIDRIQLDPQAPGFGTSACCR